MCGDERDGRTESSESAAASAVSCTHQSGTAGWQQAVCLTEQDGTVGALCKMTRYCVLRCCCNVVHTRQQRPLFYTYRDKHGRRDTL